MFMATQRVNLQIALLFLVIQSLLAQRVPLGSPTELSALLDLRSSLGLRGKDWPIKSDPCSFWIGIDCRNGRVIGINVSGLRRTRVGRLNPRFAVDSLSRLTFLTSFNSSGFSLPGSIPDWFGQRLNELQMLDLRSSSLVGPIPPSLGNMTRLSFLHLSGNSLTGVIPSSLGQFSLLSVLDLSQNLLTGSIPLSFASLQNLTHLDLSSNNLSGPILADLGSLSNLRLLNLSNNSLTSTIPKQLGSLSKLVELNLGSNSFTGSLPRELFARLNELQALLLSRNNLDGALPDDLWVLPKLSVLDVSMNNFTGQFQKLSLKQNTSVFNFSNNLFFGDVGLLVGNVSSIDLSNNYLQGKVDNNTGRNATLARNCLQMLPNQRSVDDCRVFYETRGLSFDNFGNPDPQKRNKRVVYVIAGLCGGIGFIVILVFLMVMIVRACDNGITDQRGNANVRPITEMDTPALPKVSINLSGLGESFSYENIVQATNDFNETNLIKKGHSGDLFRGVLEGGFYVVIKRINLGSFSKESYLSELELFGKVAHTRMVPLLGHCLENENEKFLVYKYMPNGDLSNSLFRVTDLEDGRLQSLDWITRLKIAIGAAEGLSYLHSECSPPLVHRDVQASSILLDDKFEVRLGSLSEVCTQGFDHHQNAITRLLRMPQTSEQSSPDPPPSTCSYDVYCFGKVLLELVTGNIGISKPHDSTVKEFLDQTLPYVSIYDKELITKIIDPSLIVDDGLMEEVWAVAIVARSCLNPKPSKRPLMRYILKALENPLKVVRQDNIGSSCRMRTSSRRSWNAAFFGSWRLSSSEVNTNREGSISGLKPIGTEHSTSQSHRRLSNEIFPEPDEGQEVEPR